MAPVLPRILTRGLQSGEEGQERHADHGQENSGEERSNPRNRDREAHEDDPVGLELGLGWNALLFLPLREVRPQLRMGQKPRVQPWGGSREAGPRQDQERGRGEKGQRNARKPQSDADPPTPQQNPATDRRGRRRPLHGGIPPGFALA